MPERSPIRVALLNDYEVIVTGLSRMLRDYADRVVVVDAEVGGPAEREVDLALYDTFGRPLGEGVDEHLDNSLHDAGRLVVYSWDCHPTVVRAALDAGAAGYVAKQAGAAELVVALERVHAGERVEPGDVPLGADDEGEGEVDWPGRREGLSARESEIVALIVQGLGNHDVAARAFLSVNTIKSYIRSAYRKMGVASRSQAVLWGIDHGFRSTTGPTGSEET